MDGSGSGSVLLVFGAAATELVGDLEIVLSVSCVVVPLLPLLLLASPLAGSAADAEVSFETVALSAELAVLAALSVSSLDSETARLMVVLGLRLGWPVSWDGRVMQNGDPHVSHWS